MGTRIINARAGRCGRHAPPTTWIALSLLLVLAGCERAPPPPAPLAPAPAIAVPGAPPSAAAEPAPAPAAPVSAGPSDASVAAAGSAATPAPAPGGAADASPASVPAVAGAAVPPTELPPGPIYACEIAGVRAPIEFPDGVEPLCRRHPEMGPCQYERNACRKRGGRVFTSTGVEVTMAAEAAYDQRVQRVTLH